MRFKLIVLSLVATLALGGCTVYRPGGFVSTTSSETLKKRYSVVGHGTVRGNSVFLLGIMPTSRGRNRKLAVLKQKLIEQYDGDAVIDASWDTSFGWFAVFTRLETIFAPLSTNS